VTAVGNPANGADVEEPSGSADGGAAAPASGDVSFPDPNELDDPDDEPALRPPSEDEMAHLADLAFATATAWTSVPDRFYTLARGVGIDPDSAPTQPLRRALGFFLTEET
jgi:hypothetical protein